MDIKHEIIEAVVPSDYYSLIFPEWTGVEDDKVKCPRSDNHKDSDRTPSLSISPETGSYHCYGCGVEGTSIVSYEADMLLGGGAIGFRRAVNKLYKKYVRGVIDASLVKGYQKKLKKSPRLRAKITARRGWTTDTMRKLKLGWDEDRDRVAIPIYNLAGLCVDIKFHDTLRKAPKKNGKRIPVLSLPRSAGGRGGDFFPTNPSYNPFNSQTIWCVEGEADTVLALQDGLSCVTLTGGVGRWAKLGHDRLRWFNGKDIIICFDNDKAGQNAAQSFLEVLSGTDVRSAKLVTLPDGNDITEFFLRYNGSASQLKQIAAATKYSIAPKNRVSKVVALSETSRADLVGTNVVTEVLVNGKSQSPVTVPRTMSLSCASDEKCPNCPNREEPSVQFQVLREDPDILEWLTCKDYRQQVKKDLSVPSKCQLSIEVTKFQNLEPVTLIPALSTKESNNKSSFVTRRGYYLGHGLDSNQHYKLTATPAVHPKTKESVLLIDKANNSHDSLKTFQLTQEQVDNLKSVFNDDPKTTLKEIAEVLSKNYTKIWGRSGLHTAVDLCYHSPLQFSFSGTVLPKGSMELILLGDTRCGKGQVTEGIASLYDLGVVVSGENASFMGLVGGARSTDRGFELSWGRLPTNHGRLVIVDEFSGYKDLGKLSRIRSEGVAELDKGGIHSSTQANTRIVWIANAKGGRELGSYTTGVEALADLVGANEDIARFDLAVMVAKGEVDVSTINQAAPQPIQSKYTRETLRAVLLWVWSRKPEHILFDRDTVSFILAASQRLSTRYSATIPLIQGENVRFKLAKLASAIAGRCFSTDDGIFLKVRLKHAKAAVALMKHYYDSPAMGYGDYSDAEKGTSKLVDIDDLDKFFQRWPPEIRMVLIDGLLEVDYFSVKEIMDWTGVDGNVAKKFGGMFVRCHAVKQTRGQYLKKPAFIKYLQAAKKKKKWKTRKD